MARLDLFKLTHASENLNINRYRLYRWNLGADISLNKSEKESLLKYIDSESKKAIKLLTDKIKEDEIKENEKGV